jgi:Tol biopolymer transport system component
VHYDKTRDYINAGLSPRGTLIYQLVNPPTRFKLAWMDRKGERTNLPVEPLPIGFAGAGLSKDGRRAAISLAGNRAESSILVVDLERGIRTPLGDPAVTFTWGHLWGPGDQSVIGSEVRADKQILVNYPLSGGPGTRVFEGQSGFEHDPASVTPDGKTLLFTESSLRDKLPNILTIVLDKDQAPKRFLQTPEGKWTPRLSPPGDIVAYLVAREEDLVGVLKVVAFPTPSASVQVSATPVVYGGFLWISAGELAWVDTSRRVWSATITTKDGRFDAGVPKPLFDGRPLDKQVGIVTDWRPEVLGERPVRK